MSEKLNKVIQKYSYEINEIQYKLKLLEEGKIKEITGADMDGYLATNINNLRKKLNELISMIVNESDSVNDKLNELFK